MYAVGCVLVILLAVGSAFAQQNPHELYERARLLEETGQTAEAIKLYSQVTSQAKDDRTLAAKAQFRIGVLNKRLGRTIESQRAFKTVVTQYPDQLELARRSQAQLVVVNGKEKPAININRAGLSPDGQFLATFTLPKGEQSSAPAFDPSRRRLYFVTQRMTELGAAKHQSSSGKSMLRTVYWPSRLVVIDTRTNTISKTVPLPVYIVEIAYNPATDKLYAAAQVNGNIRVIDPDTFGSTAIIHVPGYPGVSTNSINPVTNKIYVACQGFAGNDKLFVIDGSTNALTGPFDLGGVAMAVTVNSTTNRIYAIADERTRVFNGENMSVVADLEGLHVRGVDPEQNRIYAWTVRRGQGGDLLVLDGNTHATLATFAYKELDGRVGVDPKITRLYVPLYGRNQVVAIDTTTMTEIGRIRVSKNPSLVAVDQATGGIHVQLDNGSQMLLGTLASEAFNQQDAAAEFFDSFDGPDLDPAWEPIEGHGSYSLRESPGSLRFRTAISTGPAPLLTLMRKFRGDNWLLETKVSYFTGATGGGRDLRFTISFGSPPFEGERTPDEIIAGRGRDSWNDCCPGSVFTQFMENRVGSLPDSPLSPTDSESYIWRIRRSGRTVTVERSDDGVNSTVVGSHTFGPQIEGLIQYFSISFRSHANNDAYADYDYVRLTKTP